MEVISEADVSPWMEGLQQLEGLAQKKPQSSRCADIMHLDELETPAANTGHSDGLDAAAAAATAHAMFSVEMATAIDVAQFDDGDQLAAPQGSTALGLGKPLQVPPHSIVPAVQGNRHALEDLIAAALVARSGTGVIQGAASQEVFTRQVQDMQQLLPAPLKALYTKALLVPTMGSKKLEVFLDDYCDLSVLASPIGSLDAQLQIATTVLVPRNSLLHAMSLFDSSVHWSRSVQDQCKTSVNKAIALGLYSAQEDQAFLELKEAVCASPTRAFMDALGEREVLCLSKGIYYRKLLFAGSSYSGTRQIVPGAFFSYESVQRLLPLLCARSIFMKRRFDILRDRRSFCDFFNCPLWMWLNRFLSVDVVDLCVWALPPADVDPHISAPERERLQCTELQLFLDQRLDSGTFHAFLSEWRALHARHEAAALNALAGYCDRLRSTTARTKTPLEAHKHRGAAAESKQPEPPTESHEVFEPGLEWAAKLHGIRPYYMERLLLNSIFGHWKTPHNKEDSQPRREGHPCLIRDLVQLLPQELQGQVPLASLKPTREFSEDAAAGSRVKDFIELHLAVDVPQEPGHREPGSPPQQAQGPKDVAPLTTETPVEAQAKEQDHANETLEAAPAEAAAQDTDMEAACEADTDMEAADAPDEVSAPAAQEDADVEMEEEAQLPEEAQQPEGAQQPAEAQQPEETTGPVTGSSESSGQQETSADREEEEEPVIEDPCAEEAMPSPAPNMDPKDLTDPKDPTDAEATPASAQDALSHLSPLASQGYDVHDAKAAWKELMDGLKGRASWYDATKALRWKTLQPDILAALEESWLNWLTPALNEELLMAKRSQTHKDMTNLIHCLMILYVQRHLTLKVLKAMVKEWTSVLDEFPKHRDLNKDDRWFLLLLANQPHWNMCPPPSLFKVTGLKQRIARCLVDEDALVEFVNELQTPKNAKRFQDAERVLEDCYEIASLRLPPPSLEASNVSGFVHPVWWKLTATAHELDLPLSGPCDGDDDEKEDSDDAEDEEGSDEEQPVEDESEEEQDAAEVDAEDTDAEAASEEEDDDDVDMDVPDAAVTEDADAPAAIDEGTGEALDTEHAAKRQRVELKGPAEFDALMQQEALPQETLTPQHGPGQDAAYLDAFNKFRQNVLAKKQQQQQQQQTNSTPSHSAPEEQKAMEASDALLSPASRRSSRSKKRPDILTYGPDKGQVAKSKQQSMRKGLKKSASKSRKRKSL
jgi:hypothetical protein